LAFLANGGVSLSLLVGQSAATVWDATLGQLLLRVTRQNYDSWLRHTAGLRFDGTSLIVSVPNDLTADWLGTRMRSVIRQALTAVAGGGLKVEYAVVEPRGCNVDAPLPLQPSLLPRPTTPLNPRFTFKSFMPGRFNRLALTAAMELIDNPDTSYSPLFICGPSGSGKTHLLHAIGHRANEEGLRFTIVSADQFLSDFTNSVKERSGAAFRARYRELDLLLVDDIHTLAGKKATQQELFLTLSGLYDQGRRVVVTGDLQAATCGANGRFQGHLAWGLVTVIEPPDVSDRIEFVRGRSTCQGARLPDEVNHYLALRVRSGIRDLEGAVNRVIALGRISEEPMSIDLAARALRPVSAMPNSRQLPTQPTELIESVCRYLSVDPTVISSQKRDRALTYARQVAMYLLRQDSGLTYAAIARLLGKKDHSTVVHACSQVEKELKISPAVRADVDAIRSALRQDPPAA
jgi:chromosomal replication initiator protein